MVLLHRGHGPPHLSIQSARCPQAVSIPARRQVQPAAVSMPVGVALDTTVAEGDLGLQGDKEIRG